MSCLLCCIGPGRSWQALCSKDERRGGFILEVSGPENDAGRALAARPAIDRAYAAVCAVARRLRSAHWGVQCALLAATLVPSWLVQRAPFSTRVAVAALVPSPESLRLPIAVSSVAPLPVVVLAVLGVVSSVGRSPLRALTAFLVVQLFAVYLLACHNVGWEMLRYSTMAAAFLWLFALVGWATVDAHAERVAWRPSWRPAAVVLAALLVANRGTSKPTHPGWWTASARNQGLVVLQSKQREAQAIIRATLREPDCVFVARVHHDGRHGPMVLATFGLHQTLTVYTSPEVTLADLRPPSTQCARYFRTLDCDSAGGERCEEDLRHASPEHVTTERLAVYNDPDEYGQLAPVVRYGTYRLREGVFAAR